MSLLKKIKKRLKNLFGFKSHPTKQGEKGIKQVGHRKYVGGLWEEIGRLQYDFLIKNGLKPTDVFVDIACGSLRAGVHLIPYLNQGNYLGIDKEKSLIDLGLKHEFDPKIIDSKSPEFVISKRFDFSKFSKTPNVAIAQSLFTHLPPNLINLCFKNLKLNFKSDGVFYATYFFANQKINNPKKPHDHGVFKYTPEEIKGFGIQNGWDVEIIGDWGHPRNQKIVKYTLQ
ncbi:hypothetical protein NA63_1680 [Flavobacteriaceae bacterium MAR_2010_105]|nr:hypothetical protein NA63_1680 [Flavobacteriaceae bacterium MAR_2010_105]